MFDYGWSQEWEGTLKPGLEPCRVTCVRRGCLNLVCRQGAFEAVCKGALLNRIGEQGSMPAVGDWVLAEIPETPQAVALVGEIIPRRNCFSRKPPISGGRKMKDGILTGGYTREQVVAANMEMVFVVCGLDDDFSPSRLERYLAISGSKGISPVVLLNKADLCGPETMEERLALARKSSGDAPIRVLSALTQGGSETVSEFLKPGMTGVLVGSSGVGKSTILNSLFESAVQKTSAISAANGKGRHTTTHRELFLLPGGGLIVDTPGLRELQLWATEDDLNLSFPDVMGELGRCRFSDCGHGSEPGCHVKDALAQGSLDPERYRSYNSLLREIRHLEARKDDLEARMGKRGKPAHGSVGIDIRRRSRFPFW